MSRPGLLVLVLLAGTAAGCKTVAKGEHFERQLAEGFRAQGHTVVVSCPAAIPLAHVDSNRFQCLARDETGSTATLDVHLNDDGDLEWKVASAPDFTRADDADGDPWN